MLSKFIRKIGFYKQYRYYQKKIRYKAERVNRNPFWADFYEATFSKKGLILLLVLLPVLLFKNQIIGLYDKYVVELLLAKFNEGVLNKIIIPIVFWVLSIVFIFKKWKDEHKFLLEVTGLVTAIGGIYFYYRFIDTSKYIFFPSHFFLKYLDLIFLYVLMFGYLFYINDFRHLYKKYFKKEKQRKPHKQSFFTDTPLGAYKKERDLFSWRSKAIELVRKIKFTTAEQSFAIGISSEWGAGKTSFFNLIKEEVIPINQDKSFIVIDFNPWFSKNTRKIVDDFFNTLNEALRNRDSSLSNQIVNYSSKLQTISKDAFSKIVSTGINLYYSDSDVAKNYEGINASIKKLDKKILIFVDDLDRLDNKEVVEVLRIIRNTSNFHNCFFIIAYDRCYINNAVREINEYNSGRYLDKIIQFELYLPIYDEKLLNEVFYDKLFSKLNHDGNATQLLNSLPINSYRYTNEEQQQPSSIWEENLNFDIVNYLKNIRDIHRFLNLFIFDYNSVKKDVDFRDMFLISLLKFKYPQVWLVLSNKVHRKILLKINGGILSLKDADAVKPLLEILVFQTSKSVNESLLNDLLSADEVPINSQAGEEKPFQSVLEQLSNELLDENAKLSLLLKALFYEKRVNENAYHSIIYDSNHALYYYSGASLSINYSLSEFFQNLRNEKVSEGEFVIAIMERLNSNADVNNILGFIHQLNLSYGSLSQFRKLILSYCEVLLWKTNWPAEELLEVVARINGATGPGITEEDKKLLFGELIEKYNNDFIGSCFISFFLQQILYQYCRKEINDNVGGKPFTFLIKKEEVQAMVLKLFKKWAEDRSIPSFNSGEKNLYNLLYSCVDKIDEGSRRVRLLEGAFPAFRKAILSDPLGYLATLIRPKYYPETFEPTYLFEPYVFQIWNDYKEKKGLGGFEEFLKEVGVKNPDNLVFKRVLHFYAAVVAKKGNTLSDLDLDTSLYFENYQSWSEDPESIPINSVFESQDQEKGEKVIYRIIGNSIK